MAIMLSIPLSPKFDCVIFFCENFWKFKKIHFHIFLLKFSKSNLLLFPNSKIFFVWLSFKVSWSELKLKWISDWCEMMFKHGTFEIKNSLERLSCLEGGDCWTLQFGLLRNGISTPTSHFHNQRTFQSVHSICKCRSHTLTCHVGVHMGTSVQVPCVNPS